MDETWDGTLRVLGNSDLDELELLSSNLFSIGVPIHADPEFKAYVFAAARAHSLGNQWIDGHLRRTRERLIERFSKPKQSQQARASRLLSDVRENAKRRVLELCDLTVPLEVEPLRRALNTLIRLESTFRAASQLIRLRFAFESEAVIRLGYEQVAWANAAAGSTTLTDIENLKANCTVNRLKRLLPNAGRIYGRLSDLAHMTPSTHDRFVFPEEDTGTRIGIQIPEAALESVGLLVELLDAFLVISEFRLARFGLNASSYDAGSGTLLHDRPALLFLKDLNDIRNLNSLADGR